ncbi:epoxide hydrolase 4-like isoform X1 [Solanum pennellii]|uniref:Epoxide hydrolase 4-like isoform X1 n=1 Tax=Solanum pennellii TaxID=28526 RepID=A0ABM1HD92_SOLPN|nr:epoxide hydrolase 4-like isoform X1 [Solanum pennellii]
MFSWLSPIGLYGGFVRRSLTGAGLACQTIEIDDETTIHFWGPKSSKTKPSLILIHGFGPHGVWQWRQQISFFSNDYDLYIPSLVFFGRSTTKSPHRSEVFQANCVVKLLEKLGIEKCSIIGTSYGGFVAYHMAKMLPERVEKVIIASSAVNIKKIDNDGLLKRAKVEKIEDLMLPATVTQLRVSITASTNRSVPYLPDFFLNDFINKLYLENRKEKLELLKGLSLGRDDTVANITPLQQEVLIVWGENDQIFLLEKATELKELLGEKARLEVIKNASHVPQLEHGAKFNKIVNDFLGGSNVN